MQHVRLVHVVPFIRHIGAAYLWIGKQRRRLVEQQPGPAYQRRLITSIYCLPPDSMPAVCRRRNEMFKLMTPSP